MPILSMNAKTSRPALCMSFHLFTNMLNPAQQLLAFVALLPSHLGPSTYPCFLLKKKIKITISGNTYILVSKLPFICY